MGLPVEEFQGVAAGKRVDEETAQPVKLALLLLPPLELFHPRKGLRVMVGLELIYACEGEPESSLALGADGCAVDLVLLAEDLVALEDDGINLPASEYGLGHDAVDALGLEPPGHELDADVENGGEGGGYCGDEQVHVHPEHVDLASVRPEDGQVGEVDDAGDEDDDVDEVDGLAEELLLVLALVADRPQVLAPEGAEVGVGHQAHYLAGRVDAILSHGRLDAFQLVLPRAFGFVLDVFGLDDLAAQVKHKAPLILLEVGEVLYFFLPDEVVFAGAVLLVGQGFPSEQYAVTGHDVQLVEDDDVSWDQLVRRDGLEPDVAIVDEVVLLVLHLPAASLDDSHLHFLIVDAVEVVLHDLRPVLVQFQPIRTQLYLLLVLISAGAVVHQHLGLHVEVRFIGQFLLVAADLAGTHPVGIEGVRHQNEGKDVVLLVDPQDYAVGLEHLVRGQHLLDEDLEPALDLQLHHVFAVVSQQFLPAMFREGPELVPLEFVQVVAQFFIPNRHEDLLLLNVDVVAVSVDEGGTGALEPDLVLVLALHQRHLALGVLILDEEVGGSGEGADCGEEERLFAGGPLGEQPEEAEGEDDSEDEEDCFYFGGLDWQGSVDGWFRGVGVVQHLHLEGRIVELKPFHHDYNHRTATPPNCSYAIPFQANQPAFCDWLLIFLVMQARPKKEEEELMVIGRVSKCTNKSKQACNHLFVNRRKDLPPLLRSKHLLVDFTLRMNNRKLQQLGDQFSAVFDPDSKTLQRDSPGVTADRGCGQDEKQCGQSERKLHQPRNTHGLWMKDYLPCKKRRHTENGHKEHYNFIERDRIKSKPKMEAVIVLRQDESMGKLLKRISLRKSLDSGDLKRANTQAVEPREYKGLSASLNRSESQRVQPHGMLPLSKPRGKKTLQGRSLNDCLMMPRSQLSRLNLGIVSNLQEVSPWKQQLNEIESYCLTPAKDWNF